MLEGVSSSLQPASERAPICGMQVLVKAALLAGIEALEAGIIKEASHRDIFRLELISSRDDYVRFYTGFISYESPTHKPNRKKVNSFICRFSFNCTNVRCELSGC